MSKDIANEVNELSRTMTTQQIVYYFDKRGMMQDLIDAIPTLTRGHRESIIDVLKPVSSRVEVERTLDENKDIIESMKGN